MENLDVSYIWNHSESNYCIQRKTNKKYYIKGYINAIYY